LLKTVIAVIGISAGLLGVELISAWMHQVLFHGPWWIIHRTHHEAKKSWLELNDIFAIFFGSLSLPLFLFFNSESVFFWVGVGICLYGLVYFTVHDGFVHRRIPLRWKKKEGYIAKVVQGHRVHHQKADKAGQGPFGLFWLR
jgi:beta-carotene 3-hydroxylase